MKKFKPGILLTAITTLLAFMSVLYISSCDNKAPALSPTTCENVVCQNFGVCNLGTCVCPTGYEGLRCQSAVNAKFAGTWQVSEAVVGSDHFDTVGQTRAYAITIDTASTPTSIFLRGLRGNGTYGPISATIDSTKVGFIMGSYSPVSNGNFTIIGGYASFYAVSKTNDSIYVGFYNTNYLNAQTAIEHDTIRFTMTR